MELAESIPSITFKCLCTIKTLDSRAVCSVDFAKLVPFLLDTNPLFIEKLAGWAFYAMEFVLVVP